MRLLQLLFDRLAGRSAAPTGGRAPDPYRPLGARAPLWVALATLAVVAVIVVGMLRPHQQLMNAKVARAEAARRAACPPGAASASAGCPGGTMPVMVLPAAPAASR